MVTRHVQDGLYSPDLVLLVTWCLERSGAKVRILQPVDSASVVARRENSECHECHECHEACAYLMNGTLLNHS